MVAALSTLPLQYVGLLASRHRIAQDSDELRKRGVASEFLTSLHAPIRLDISAKSREELAVAILAEAILVQRRRPAAGPAGG